MERRNFIIKLGSDQLLTKMVIAYRVALTRTFLGKKVVCYTFLPSKNCLVRRSQLGTILDWIILYIFLFVISEGFYPRLDRLDN